MTINLEVTDDELREAAKEVSGSEHPDDYNMAIDTFREMVEALERMQR